MTPAIRMAVKVRDLHRCVVCRLAGSDVHHRRTRRVDDEHTHCRCNLILLCGKGNTTGDHGWVHGNPFEARRLGLIVSRYESRMPFEVPMFVVDRWVLLGCEGSITETSDPEGPVS